MNFRNTGTIEIETERLLLRRFRKSDSFDMLKNWIADPKIQHNYGEPTYDTTDKVADLIDKWIVRYEDKEFYRWAIISKDTKENIGQIAFCKVYSEINTAEVEYCISSNYSRKGYATESLKGVIRFALKKAGLNKVEGFHRVANAVSGIVMRKAGMKVTSSIARSKLEGYDISNKICYEITQPQK